MVDMAALKKSGLMLGVAIVVAIIFFIWMLVCITIAWEYVFTEPEQVTYGFILFVILVVCPFSIVAWYLLYNLEKRLK